MSARLTKEQHEGLQRIADANNVEKITALRWAADALISYAKARGWKLLEIDFNKQVRTLHDPLRIVSPVTQPEQRSQTHSKAAGRD